MSLACKHAFGGFLACFDCIVRWRVQLVDAALMPVAGHAYSENLHRDRAKAVAIKIEEEFSVKAFLVQGVSLAGRIRIS